MKSLNEITKTKTFETLIRTVLCVAFLGGSLSLCSCDLTDEAVTETHESDPASALTERGEHPMFATQIVASLPQWSDDMFLATREIGSQPDDLFDGPSRILEVVNGPLDLSFYESRANGNAVFVAKDRELLVKHNAGLGYWKMIAPHKEVSITAPISDEEAVGFALHAAAEIGLSEEEFGEVRAAGVASQVELPDGTLAEPRVIARHVRLSREVNGLPVFGSTYMATYNLDGDPFRVEVRWPRFQLAAARRVEPRHITEVKLAALIENDAALVEEPTAVRSTLGYFFDETEGTFAPGLTVEIDAQLGEATREFHYSLVTGSLIAAK